MQQKTNYTMQQTKKTKKVEFFYSTELSNQILAMEGDVRLISATKSLDSGNVASSIPLVSDHNNEVQNDNKKDATPMVQQFFVTHDFYRLLKQ